MDDLPPFAIDFLGSIRAERGLAKNTAEAYRRDLIAYQRTLEASGTEGEEGVRNHLAELRELGLAPTTVARSFATIRSYHRFLVLEGLTDDDPTAGIDPPSRPTGLPKALTVNDVEQIIEQPDDSTKGVRDRAMLEFLYATGCRVTELVDTDLHDLDLETRSVVVTGKGSKQRLVPLGSFAIDAIGRWLPLRTQVRRDGADSGALFLTMRGNRLSRQSIWRIVKQYGAEAGIDRERLSPHVFRHSAATHMVEGGADLRTVQEMLGHASLSTTQVYTKVSPEHLYEVVLTSHPRSTAR